MTKHRLKFITEAIRNLDIGASTLIPDAASGSVKSIVSRLRKAYKGRRRFKTKKVLEGTAVMRLP